MRLALTAGVAALALLASVRSAAASPPIPVPLERKVEDADLVVVVRLLTRPVHSGDEFEVSVGSA